MSEGRSSALLLAAVGSGLVGGAVGALLVVLLTRSASPEVRAKPEPIVEPGTPAPQLEGRVAALERSLRALALRESTARAHSPPAASAQAGPSEPAPADVAPIVDNPVFEAAVRDVMDRAEQERDAEREAQRAEWRKQAAQDWASGLTDKLRLTEAQKVKLVEISSKFWEQLRARPGDSAEPESRQQRRERMDALRKSAEEELGKVLDATQLATYRGLDEAERLGTPRNARQRQRRPGTEQR